MKRPEETDNSSTPEEWDQYSYGDYYFHIRTALQKRTQKFKTQAYFPNNGGVRTITNQNTANGSVRIIDGNNLREPDESDLMYFTRDAAEQLGLDVKKLKKLKDGEPYNPEETGVYRKIDRKVLEGILNEDSPTPEIDEKKAG